MKLPVPAAGVKGGANKPAADAAAAQQQPQQQAQAGQPQQPGPQQRAAALVKALIRNIAEDGSHQEVRPVTRRCTRGWSVPVHVMFCILIWTGAGSH
jgi:hypothetical protein